MAAANIFESNVPQYGDRATESAHRKIELQSPADLSYIIANVTRAAREKLDRHLPPDAAPNGEDAMRQRVEQLVDEYIRNTFTAAKDSLSINGMDSREMEAELAKAQDGEGEWFGLNIGALYLVKSCILMSRCAEIEPFDTKLAQRIQALSGQIESQTLQLANLRRNAPAETAQRYNDTFAKQSQEYDARLRKSEDSSLEAAKNIKIDVGEVERLDEMQVSWQKGTENLNTLKSGLGSTVAKMERARKAVDYVEEK